MFKNIKRHIRAINLILLILTCATVLSAQDKIFTDDDFRVLRKNAYEKLEGRKYQKVTTFDYYYGKDSKSNSFRRITNKVVPPNRKHNIYETKTSDGMKTVEWIYIGKQIYRKKHNEDWKLYIPSGSGNGSGVGRGEGSGFKPVTTYEYRLISGQIVNGQESDLYEKITRYTFSPDNVVTDKSNHWFNKEGLFSKILRERIYSTSDSYSRTTTDYTYDANLTIEAPNIRKQVK